jgi:hypothetical protein
MGAGHTERARAEAATSRHKRVVGDGPRAHGRAPGGRGGRRHPHAPPHAGAGAPGPRPRRLKQAERASRSNCAPDLAARGDA